MKIFENALPDQFDLDPEVEAALVDASLEFSKCMRDEGISNFPDPTPGEFGFLLLEMQILNGLQTRFKKHLKFAKPEKSS